LEFETMTSSWPADKVEAEATEGITGQNLAGLFDLDMQSITDLSHKGIAVSSGVRLSAVGPQLCPALAGDRRRAARERTERRRRERAAENGPEGKLRAKEFDH
jgi:hypothetical protein